MTPPLTSSMAPIGALTVVLFMMLFMAPFVALFATPHSMLTSLNILERHLIEMR